MSLCACGGNVVQGEPAQTLGYTIMQAPIGEKEFFYNVSFLNTSMQAVGYGKDGEEAVYDAVAGIVSEHGKPGTDMYRAMLTEQGMTVWLKEESTGQEWKVVVRETKEGMVISVE